MSLLQNQINIYVNANGELVPGSAPTNFLYRNNLNRNVFFIVTPLSEAAVVKLIFKNTSLAKQGYTDVALPTQQKGSNITNETASYYNIVKDWNVFKCIPNETILAKFPSTVTGTIALTVSIKEPDLSDTTLYTFVKDIYTNDTASIEALTNRQYVRCASAQVITAYGTMYVGDKLVNKNGTKIIIHAIWSSSTTEPLEFVGNPALEDNDYEDVVVGDTSLLDSIISTLANQSQSVTQLQSYLSEILTGNTTGASLIHVVDALPTDTSNIANGTLYALRYINTYDQKTYEYKFYTWTGSKWLPKDALSYLGGTITSQATVDAIPNGTYFVLKMDSSFIDPEITPQFNNSPAILIKTYDTLTCVITSYYCYVYNSIRQTWTTMPLSAEKHVSPGGWKLITSGGVYDAVKSVKDNVDKVVDGTTQVGIAGKAVQDQNGAVINTTYQKVAEKGIAGGYAPLNASGKVPDSYLPSDTSKFYAGTITSGVCAVNQAFITKFGVSTLTISANDINTYDGAYFVATDNFIIASGNAGNAITLTSGDELISHGSVGYAKIDSNNDVVSVNGLTGAVVIRFDNYAGSISSITPTIASGLDVDTRYMTSDGYEFRVSLPQNDRVLLLYEIADKKVVVVKRGTMSTDTWDDDPQYKKKLVGEVEFTSSKTLEEAIKFIAHKDLQGDIYTVETTDYGNVFVFNEEESGTTTQYSLLANGYVYKVNYDTATDTYEIISYSTLISITHANLLAKVNAGTLIAGQQYRITDYTCSTSTIDTQSAGHQFDIIVKADSSSVLNENARAILHDGDTYFANAKISAWELKYSLTNDTTRFAWAVSTGKGVIYWMKDEFNNDCPYDFKNIQFKRKLTNGVLDLVGGVDTWVYTFTMSDIINVRLVDISLKQNTEYPDDEQQYRECDNNSIKEAILDYEPDGLIRLKLNDNVFLNVFDSNDTYSYDGCYSNTFGNYCYSNTFGTSCSSNTFGTECSGNAFGTSCFNNTFGTECSRNTFGNSCYNNTFGTSCSSNTFGTSCSRNTFGTECNKNTFGTECNKNTFDTNCYNNAFGTECSGNTFGTECSGNTFGTGCSRNTFGTGCNNNTFGNECSNNTFGNSCYSNTFGNNCNRNTFGSDCNYNTFGKSCYFNTFGKNCHSNTFGTECSNNTFGNSCQYDKITGNSVRYLNIDNGIQGASAANKLELYDSGAIANKEYQISFKKSASGRYLMLWATDTGTMTGKYKALNTDAIWTAL